MGGGIGMGNTCKPMAVLFQCMTKFTTNKKKKKKKEIGKQPKKKKNPPANAGDTSLIPSGGRSHTVKQPSLCTTTLGPTL